MRPLPGTTDALAGRWPRRTSSDNLCPFQPAPAAPTTCFLTTESDLGDAGNASTASSRPSLPKPGAKDAVDTASSTRSCLVPEASSLSRSSSPFTSSCSSMILDGGPLDISSHDHYRPLSPSLSPVSAFSNASSRRPSLTASSVAVATGSLSNTAATRSERSAFPNDASPRDSFGESTVPQLVMPRAPEPRRRPFTELGKSVGKLKILVSGYPGSGKTSLIRSMAQVCEHIVHIDDVDSSVQSRFKTVYASTRPCPLWQLDTEASISSSVRRRSLADVLDRNLCFVDSLVRNATRPGDWSSDDGLYVFTQLIPLWRKEMSDEDLGVHVSGGAGSAVDLVLYLLPLSGMFLRQPRSCSLY